MLLLNASHWEMPVTEKPVLGSTEIWTLINPTNDTHPIHLHLVHFQILDRQPYEPWLSRPSASCTSWGRRNLPSRMRRVGKIRYRPILEW
ncbi:MAG: multicopper oxidase domain-containing protein [Candidatus Sulfotelmatobacter sp.]